MARARFVLLAAMLVLVAGCRPVYFGDAVPYPDGCAQLGLDESRCEALVDAARSELGIREANVAQVDLLTDDRCEYDRSILCSRSATLSLSVRFTMGDGSFRWIALGCTIGAAPKPYC